jgi:hypothetical protein
MSIVVRERMSKSFVLLPGTLAPPDALQQLEAAQYGVVLDPSGAPVGLVLAEDLKEASRHGAPSLLSPLACLPATLVVGSEVEMQRLADSEALTLFDIGALGAVVVDDEGVAGILPIETVDEYLGSGAYKPAPEVMGPTAKGGDAGLGGKHQTPEGFVICVATVDDAPCGHVNKVAFLDKNHLPVCQNPNLQSHTLQITSK